MGEYYRRASLAARRLAKNLYDRPVPKGVNPVVWLMKVAVEPSLQAEREEGRRDKVAVEVWDLVGEGRAWERVLGFLSRPEGRDLLKEVVNREKVVLEVKRSDLALQLVGLAGIVKADASSLDLT